MSSHAGGFNSDLDAISLAQMTDSDHTAQEPAAFRAVLHPYRSLGPRGFLYLMCFFGVASFIAGVVFVSMGAWPVFGFFGLDVLLLYVAFKINYRSARALEIVELTRSELTVIRQTAAGLSERISFNPYWVRVKLTERPDGRTALSLISQGKSLVLGALLSDDERRTLAAALNEALLKTGSAFA